MADQTFPPNPYIIDAPLAEHELFPRRKELLDFLQTTIEAGQQKVVVLYGPRRSGKSSLLLGAADRLKKRGKRTTLYFDLQGRERQPLGETLYDLAQAMARSLRSRKPKPDEFDESGQYFQESFLPVLYKKLGKKRLVLLLDEFHLPLAETVDKAASFYALFPYLQQLSQTEDRLSFVVAAGRRLEETPAHFRAIFPQAAYRAIGHLTPVQAQAVILKPTNRILTFEKRAVETIMALAAHHPYFTQLLAFTIFQAMAERNERVVSDSNVLSLAERAVEIGHEGLSWLWAGLPATERLILSAIAQISRETDLVHREAIRSILEQNRLLLTGPELNNALDRLMEWNILSRDESDGYAFAVELQRRWVAKRQPLETARQEGGQLEPEAARLYEQARQAHSRGDLAAAREGYERILADHPHYSGAQLGLAQLHLEANRFEEAIEAYSRAYSLDELNARPGLVRAYVGRAKKLEESLQQNEAISHYEQALQLDPDNETAARRLAAIWLKRGQQALVDQGLPPALELFRKTLAIDSSEKSGGEIRLALKTYALQREENEAYEEALAALEQLNQLLPQSKAILNREMASLWAKEGRRVLETEGFEAAAIPYGRALDLSDDEKIGGQIRHDLEAYARQAEADRRYKEAIQVIHHLQELVPEDQTRFNRRLAAIWLGRGHATLADSGLAAVEFYQQALALNRSEQITEAIKTGLDEYARRAEADQNYDEALRAIDRLGRLLPEEAAWVNERQAAIWTARGHTLVMSGTGTAAEPYQKAIEQLQQLLPEEEEQLNQRLALIWLTRGHNYLAAEGLEAALTAYRKALDFSQREPIVQGVQSAIDAYARQAEADRNYAEAIQAIEQLGQLLPEERDWIDRRTALHWLARGDDRLRTEGVEAAAESYREALAHDRSGPVVDTLRQQITAYIEQAETAADYDRAARAIDLLRELLPDDGAVFELELAFWIRTGDALAQNIETGQQAMRAYQRALTLDPNDTELTQKLEAVSATWEKLPEADRIFNQAIAAHQNKDWTTAAAGWLRLLKMDAVDYKGHNIAALLTEATRKSQYGEEEQQTLFEQGWQAHQAKDWAAAEEAWEQLLDWGVETYNGREIALLLNRAREKRQAAEQQQPVLTDHPAESRPRIPAYLWTIGLALVLLLLIGGGMALYRANQRTAAAATAQAAQVNTALQATETALSCIALSQAETATAQAEAIAAAPGQATATAQAAATRLAQAQATAVIEAGGTAASQAEATVIAEAQAAATLLAQATATAEAQVNATAQVRERATVQAKIFATARAMPTATAQARVTAAAIRRATAQAQATATTQAILSATTILTEDFTTNDRGWWTGQESSDFSDREAQIVDGKYRISMTSKRDVFWPVRIPQVTAANFWLGLEATIMDNPPDNAGFSIVFRANQNGDFYRVRFDNNNQYLVQLRVNEEWQTISGSLSEGNIQLAEGIANTFGLLVQGTELSLYANGQQLTTLTDSTLSGSSGISLGLNLSEADQTLTVDFDNIVIKEAP